MRMGLEELRIEWKEFRLEDFFDTREIDFRVLRPWVIAMNCQGGKRQQNQNQKDTDSRGNWLAAATCKRRL